MSSVVTSPSRTHALYFPALTAFSKDRKLMRQNLTKMPHIFETLIVILLTILPFHLVLSQDQDQDKETIMDFSKLEFNQKLLKGSRWSIERKQSKKKIIVHNAIEIVDITKVDVDTMSIRVELFLRQRWDGDEVELPPNLFKETDSPEVFVQADPKILASTWSPDSFIPTARESKIADLTTEQSIVNIFKNKTIVFKARLFTVLGCLFDFRWYPLDKQTCTMQIQSYSQTEDVVSYVWETTQPEVFTSGLKLLQYDILLPIPFTNGSSTRWGRGEKYPYVEIDFIFDRKLGNHMIQVFIPTTLVVILSWFSFWLGLDAIPGRVSLLITCMLTLVTMHGSLKSSIPPVNYVKMTDVWMVGCMSFVFLALCEFVIVKYLHWRKQQEQKAAEDKEKYMKDYAAQMKDLGRDDKDSKSYNPYLEFYRSMNEGPFPYPRPAWQGQLGGPLLPYGQNPYLGPHGPVRKRPVWVVIDRVSRALFPLSFAAFNAIFWPWLLVGAENQ